jgi:predicted Rossmann fold flavoprotein
MQSTLVVIGGGAAGFFCAINAARLDPLLKVILLEKTNKLLAKVKISGGGRCNVTHGCFDITGMSRKYPRGSNFLKKAFHHFFVPDTIRWFEERGVTLKTEADGRMFPVSDSSQTIIDCLLREANRYGVDIRMHAEVSCISLQENGVQLVLSDNRQVNADFVCIACGGYPKSQMFHWIAATGHTIIEPAPSLFTFNLPGHPITHLMGVSVIRARVKITGTKWEEEGPLLVTHWGLSGPVILRLSAWGARELKERDWNFEIRINWLPDYTEQTLREAFQSARITQAAQRLYHRNPFGLPARLWDYFLFEAEVKEETRWADLSAKTQNKLIGRLAGSQFDVKGKTTFKEEFVTAGGVQLGEVDPNTMMSRKVPNLYFAGETLDIDGITGGFNFQNAWTTGFIAASHIAGRHLSS